VVSWYASACQMASYRGPQPRSVAAAAGAAKPPRRPRGQQDRTAPRGIGAQRRFRDRDEIGPLGAFLRLEREGIGRPAIPTEQKEENAARGPESARSHTRGGCVTWQGAARRRAAGAQRWRMAGPRNTCVPRARLPRTRGRGRRPRMAGGHGNGDGDGDWG